MQIVIMLDADDAAAGGGDVDHPFLRIVVVLHFLRQALGTQSTPSNQVLLGLALFLALLVMQPVITDMYHQGWEPMEYGPADTRSRRMEQGAEPLHNFLVEFARERISGCSSRFPTRPRPALRPIWSSKILIPAYILSELKTGFQIGAVLFLPFLMIDLVIASVTLSIGMVQLPPVMISAPFKILLFVLVDGWNLVVGSLMKSFYS